MGGIWLRLRNVLNGRFVSDATPKRGGGMRQTYVETIKKRSGKKK
jgi:hypothetical protein